ncbi:uncharacterized protein LOC104585198 [Brachypodium distachyon]|uniref:NAC domain-containing protein n=1 Tax=Brachypodium distachyon TaxID=15368 RepID=I1IUI4_BRADI|nr:uncharacterized protein LOC104585198 [Brachypodium distachyon]KQJ92338.1 hypothetical protein BRADI_4g43010v3 [Brachypodium distachyon]|eukprot:XP_010239526.1 uncharacterized protein LOC104585198 [Brachypodium distachyon]
MELDMEVFQLCRFHLSPLEAVTYYLPRLLSGESLNGAERLIHRADIYGNLETKDLAAAFPPAPKAERTGDRFFLTLCKRQKGSRSRSARAAGAGTWTIQRTLEVVDHAGVKKGEVKKLSFKKGIKKEKESTGWVMEEYHCLLPEAVVADGEMVLCKIHLSPTACDEARQESAAYLAGTQEQEDQPARMPVTAKRPAPAAPDHDPPCAPKRARVAAAEADHSQDIDAFRSPLEDLLADQPAVEADDDNTGRLTCTMDELLGGATDEDQEDEATALPAGETEQQTVDFDLDLPVLDEDALSEVILSLDEDLPIASDEDFDFEFPTAEELNAMMVWRTGR